MRRAFKTIYNGVESITSADSASKARYRTYISACEVFRSPKLIDIRVIRAPKHDAWAQQDESGNLWGEEYLPKTGGHP